MLHLFHASVYLLFLKDRNYMFLRPLFIILIKMIRIKTYIYSRRFVVSKYNLSLLKKFENISIRYNQMQKKKKKKKKKNGERKKGKMMRKLKQIVLSY